MIGRASAQMNAKWTYTIHTHTQTHTHTTLTPSPNIQTPNPDNQVLSACTLSLRALLGLKSRRGVPGQQDLCIGTLPQLTSAFIACSPS